MEATSNSTMLSRSLWLMGFVVLLAFNAVWTMRFFEILNNPRKLLEPTPVVSGRHALHTYHGQLGAQSWLDRGSSSCFDPNYMAGYPKTPIFDSGCRPAEFFYLPGHKASFVSYKVGLFVSCLLIPIFFASMAVGLELTPRGRLLASLFSVVIWWAHLNAELLIEGELDVLLGGIAALTHCCWLIRFAHQPSFHAWCVLALSAAISWHIQPILILVFIPPIMVHYLWHAFRHSLFWHVSLYAAWALALGVNEPWLREWQHYIGLMLPVREEQLFPSNLQSLWQDWKEVVPADPVVLAFAGGGLLGLPYMAYRHRSGFLMLSLSAICIFLASNAHRIWPMIEELRLWRLPQIMVWFAIFPFANLLDGGSRFFARHLGGNRIGIAWLVVVLAGLTMLLQIPENWKNLPRLRIGLSPERVAIVQELRNFQSPSRILWEDSLDHRENGWTALLATLTGQQYLGGLEPESRMENFYARLVEGRLAGREISHWTDEQFDQFFNRYNVGRVAARSEASIVRFRRYANAKEEQSTHPENMPVRFFTLKREPSYFLKGKGKLIEASNRRIALADVVPEEGEVILSLHYQQGWMVLPGVAEVERQVDANDPIPFIRLWLPSPVTRLTLEWRGP